MGKWPVILFVLLCLPVRATARAWWVFFRDKGPGRLEAAPHLERARLRLAPRARLRRARVRGGDIVDERDLPLAGTYLQALGACGVRLRFRSRWLNAASIEGGRRQLDCISRLPCVSGPAPVRRGRLLDRPCGANNYRQDKGQENNY